VVIAALEFTGGTAVVDPLLGCVMTEGRTAVDALDRSRALVRGRTWSDRPTIDPDVRAWPSSGTDPRDRASSVAE
jgi:hypothetical protein